MKLMMDNMTALSDVSHIGTSSSEKRNDLDKEIWSWFAQRNIWLTAVHTPGVEKLINNLDSLNRNFSGHYTELFSDTASL